MKNDAAVIDTEPSVGRLNAVLQRLTQKPDADIFFDKHVRDLLPVELDPKDIGFYQRLNTYLFQLTHYVGLIDRDIKSWRMNQFIYLVVYVSGMISVPVWLIYLEISKFGQSNMLETWSLLFLYSLVLLTGINFSVKIIKKIKLINDSRNKLQEKALEVVRACSRYNVEMFNDKNNGTTPGFDKDLNLALQLNDILDNEFQTIIKSYRKYLLENEHFDYPNLAGIIRAHQALYSNRIKSDAEYQQQQRDEFFRFADDIELNSGIDRNIEQTILERHVNQMKNIHEFYIGRILDMRSGRKHKKRLMQSFS